MSEVYLVVATGGSYSDAWTENLAAFTDNSTAEAYMKVKEELADKIKKAYKMIWQWDNKNYSGKYETNAQKRMEEYKKKEQEKSSLIDTFDFLNDEEKANLKDPYKSNYHKLHDTNYHIEMIDLDVGF